LGEGLKRLGVLGTMIWDTIQGRDPRESPVEEWGGISYGLAGLDAALPPDWEVVPLVKVGRDLAPRAAEFLRTLARASRGARFIEVPEPNPRVKLSYLDDQRRCEGLTGGLPTWTWAELGPLLLGLEALYVNFITGFECDLATAQALRRGFAGPIYGDLHSLALGIREGGTRYYRPIEEALAWLACFDVAQVNEDEMRQLGDDPMTLAARALERGVGAVCVTLGARGAVYVAAGDFTSLAWAGAARCFSPRPALFDFVALFGEVLDRAGMERDRRGGGRPLDRHRGRRHGVPDPLRLLPGSQRLHLAPPERPRGQRLYLRLREPGHRRPARLGDPG